jgi:hypothetical protein
MQQDAKLGVHLYVYKGDMDYYAHDFKMNIMTTLSSFIPIWSNPYIGASVYTWKYTPSDWYQGHIYTHVNKGVINT